MNEEFQLTQEQNEKIQKHFGLLEKPDLATITRDIFQDNTLTGKTKEGRAVKKFCQENNLQFSVRTVILKGVLPMTPEQILIIQNNYRVTTPLKLTRQVFGDDTLTNLSQEYRTIEAYLETLEKEKTKLVLKEGEGKIIEVGYDREEITEEDYKSPSTTKQTIARINQYLLYNWDEATLKKQQLFQVEQLKKYLNIFRFIYQINTYKKKSHRN